GPEITRCRFDDGVVPYWAPLNKANNAQIAKDCGEQFYTDATRPSVLASWSASFCSTGGKSSCLCSIVCRTRQSSLTPGRCFAQERTDLDWSQLAVSSPQAAGSG